MKQEPVFWTWVAYFEMAPRADEDFLEALRTMEDPAPQRRISFAIDATVSFRFSTRR